MCKLILLLLSIMKNQPTTRWIQATLSNQVKANRKRVGHLQEVEWELMKKNLILIESNLKLLRKTNMIQESIEFIEEFEKIQMIGQEKVLKLEFP